MMIPIKVTVITPMPMTFHSFNSAGGVADTSPTHPVVPGSFEDDDVLYKVLGCESGVVVCTKRAVLTT
jgi:hypothetical protein